MERRRRALRLPLYEARTYRRTVAALAKNLKRLREQRGWTQEQASEACGLGVRALQALELGERNVTLVTLAQVADGFGVSVASLLA
jgi:transcriptional regulator with XRE-family HTH domain